VSERTARLATSMPNDQHPNEMIVGPMIVPDQRGQHRDDRNSKQKPDCCEPVGYKREHVPLA
jgi:hypothetical protein